MQIIEVKNKAEAKQFLDVCELIYKNDKVWIRHIDKDIEAVFDENKNPYLKNGEAKRWMLYNEKNIAIGRIAAYISYENKSKASIGFFECIDDENAAKFLFDTAIHFLKKNGAAYAEAPVNFGERDKFWGLLVEGFENPSYTENYNPLYYKELFEDYGFKKIFEQKTQNISTKTFDLNRLEKIAQRVKKNTNYSFRHFKNSERKKFAEDFVAIYNDAWQQHEHFSPMTVERIYKLMQEMKPLIIEKIIWFAYSNNTPAAFIINILEANQYFKYLNGKMNFIAKLKFLWYRYTSKPKRTRAIVFGIRKQFQNLGLETVLLLNVYSETKKIGIHDSEISWVGDFNPKMLSAMTAIGGKNSKTHFTYEKKL